MTTHAAFSSLCLSALLAASLATARAADPAETAAETAVRFQARVQDARKLNVEARVAEARKEILAASQRYNGALELVSGIGAAADPERNEAIAGLSRTTLHLADQAMKFEDFATAKLHIDRVLKVDPTNKKALEMRAENERLTVMLIDKTPHAAALETLARTETNRVEVGKLVQDGKLYYETGRLKEADEALRRAIRIEPDNQGAHYYLNLVIARKFAEQARLREVNSKQMLMEVESAWADPVTRKELDIPNSYARTNLIFTGDARQAIYLKLRNLHLNEWGPIDNLPLNEVIRGLNDETRKRDVGGKGLNFIVSPNADAGAGGAAGGVDPITGIPAPADAGGLDLNAVTIKLGTKLTDLSLEQILNIVEKIADRKIKYSVEDFGIIISPRAAEPTPLHTRFFHVDPNTFQQGLQGVTSFTFGESSQGGGGGGGGGGGRGGGGGGRGGGGGGGGRGNQGGGNQGGNNQNGGSGQGGGATYAQVSIAGTGNAQGGGAAARGGAPGAAGGAQQQAGAGISFLTTVTPQASVIPTVQAFFVAAGVGDLAIGGKSIFYNDRLGLLMVRATLGDLDLIEKAMQILNMAPPQLTIRAKFMEVNQDDSRALGFDWYLGNTSLSGGSKSIVGSGGSSPTLVGNGPGSTRPPFPNQNIPIAPSATDQVLTSGLRNSAPQLATITGILTDPQFRVVLRALEQRGASDLLSAPEVTTMSGRQAQIKVVDIRYIVTDLSTDQTAAGTGGGGGGNNNNTGGGGIGSQIIPTAEPFELGPVLDVVPYVNADGFTIQMTLLPTLKEFLGYDDPGQFVAQIQGSSASGGNQAALTQPIPLPKFRLRQVATTAMVWDGQTVMLGGLISETVQKQKDKVPVLGDLPFFGRFFRSESSMSSKKNLVIFVTPRIIDPAGNPLHSEEEMPFAAHTALAPRAVTQ